MSEEEREEAPDEADACPFPPCPECGMIHARKYTPKNGPVRWTETCTAHKRAFRDGDPENHAPENVYKAPCLKYAMRGLAVCTHHGGKSPQVQRRLAEQLANAEFEERKRLEIQDVNPAFMDQHPIEGLLEEVARSAQVVSWLSEQVAKLELVDAANHSDSAYVSGMGEDGQPTMLPVRSMLIGPNHQGDLKRHPLWVALDEERERHAKLCKTALDAGVNEKMVNIAQNQATRMVTIILKVLDVLNLREEDKVLARRTVAAELRAAGPGGLAAIEARAVPRPDS